ncbi:MAG: hypothetical protein FVQ82_14925 [Planctomycetes bacterium]|nr:hypothetical protein [Planctomycetota bacterium]
MIKNRFQNLSKADKVHTWIAAAVTMSLLLAYITYKCFAHSLIEAMYYGKSLDILNNLMKFQHKYSLDHYLNSGDLIFARLIYLTAIFSVLLILASYLVNRLFFSEKKIRFVYVLAFCLLVQMLVSILNPRWRIYYNHGFFRGSISYQIQNSGIPAQDPLFAGEVVRSPWGFAWLGAQVSTLLNITPFHAFNLINSINICLIALLAYKISGQFFKDRKANICSALFSIFGVTIFPRHLLQWMGSFLYSARTEWRATPFFQKFISGSGDPTGMLFFLLFVFAAIQIIKNRNIWLYTFIMILAIVGGGFLYAPMLPGVIGSILLISITYPLFAWKGHFVRSPRPVIHLIAALAISIAMLIPYFRSVSSGVGSHAALFHLEYLWPHLVSFVLPLAPIILLIFFSRKFWLKKADTQILLLLSIIIVANLGMYSFVHILAFAEYKFLILAAFFVGIFGGIAFYTLQSRMPRIAVLFILALFLWPSADHIVIKLKRLSNKPLLNVLFGAGFLEKGTDLFVTDSEENEMYDWIKGNTGIDRVFVDSTMKLPIYAKRRLLIGPGGKAEAGYSMHMDLIKQRNGYDDKEYNKRKAIIQNIYGLDDSLNHSYVRDYISENNILIIVRNEDLGDIFEYPGLSRVFNSTQERFQVFEAR